jgi:hypothetical protein
MEHELQKQATQPTQKPTLSKKRRTDLPLVDIYCIGAVGFLRNLRQLDTVAFTTSLYEIDQIIQDKEIEAIRAESAQDELTNEELIDQKLPH